MNPAKAGALGPAVTGASLELLQLRVKKGTYPSGYKPKRNTKLMVPMPHITDADIKALHAYLNQTE